MKTSNDEIKISAILPNYNSSVYLRQAIQTLVDQTEPFHEIIIVDDASTDNSLEIIHDFMDKHSNIQLLQHTINQGVNAAMNTALQVVTGDYLLFRAADDWCGAEVVARVKQIITSNQNVGLVCGNAVAFDEKKRIESKRGIAFSIKNAFVDPVKFRSIIQKRYVGFNGGGVFYNRKALIEAGGYNSAIQWYSDWLVQMIIASRYGLYYTDEVFVTETVRKTSFSAARRNLGKQLPVLINLLSILFEQYSDVWMDFKKAGLLPNYETRYFYFFLKHKILRRYLTIKLMWKFLMHNPLVVYFGRLFPNTFILKMRKLVKA